MVETAINELDREIKKSEIASKRLQEHEAVKKSEIETQKSGKTEELLVLKMLAGKGTY